MSDTFAGVWNKVLLRCPAADPFLAQDWVKNAFRRVAERRRWSWLLKRGQFLTTTVYKTGTATTTRGSQRVTGTSTVWDQSHVGQQFRIGTQAPIYTILSVINGTTLDLDQPWGYDSLSAQGYEIYTAYGSVPADFHALVSVIDQRFNWQLNLNLDQNFLDRVDAQRSNPGNPYCVVPRDYTTSKLGTVDTPLQVLGTGPGPSSSGSYSAPSDSIFTVECTTGGASGTAQFRWKKDSGSYTSAVVTDENGQSLQDGVNVFWPTALTYVLGDIWVIRCLASNSPGVPRYELWPHQKAQAVYPFLYETRPVDLDVSGSVIPQHIRGDVLLDMALAEAARWPGPSADKPNPFFSLPSAAMHDKRVEQMIAEMERQDDEVYEQDATYQWRSFGFAQGPWGDADWLQKHGPDAWAFT